VTYFVRTERLGFRTWSADDFELALGLWGDPDVTRWIDSRARLSDDDVRERLEREIAMQRDSGVQYWPIFRLDGDVHVGCCGLKPYDSPRRVYELGVHIRPTHWRKGYALEATRAVIDHAFIIIGADALFAGHHPKHESSRRLLTKIGFEYTHHEFYAPTGLLHPSYLLESGAYEGPGTLSQAPPGGALPLNRG
jgi:ribosomal-protein-alanine N-acetyltransferase